MRRTPAVFFSTSRCIRFNLNSTKLASEPIVRINNGTFYHSHPASKPHDASPNPPLFPNLTLDIPSSTTPNQHWAILSPSSTIRTAFLQMLRGNLLCFPPPARTFPYLLSSSVAPKNRVPERAIEYVGFDAERQAFGGAYLSARYESRVEETDFTLKQYLTGIVGMNPGEDVIKERAVAEEIMRGVVRDLELERFLDRPVSLLSNGQSRRARIGRALLKGPEVLCLDAPFIGLDPFVSKHISELLHRLAEARKPRIVLSLRPQDGIPEWVTHVVYAGEDGKVQAQGEKEEVLRYLKNEYEKLRLKDGVSSDSSGSKSREVDPNLVEIREVGKHLSERGGFEGSTTAKQDLSNTPPLLSRDGFPKFDNTPANIGEPIVQMEGVRIAYSTNSVLGDWHQDVNSQRKDGLWWTVHRGQRWGIFGANGSGKTTLLSLVTSDHPQTYSAPVKIFGRGRLPAPGVPGITIFDIQSQIGHASPEIHALFPKNLSVRRTLESAWSDTPITPPRLDAGANVRAEACLRWFEAELNPKHSDNNASKQSDWARDTYFGELSFSAQRTALFLRATLRNPPIVILDEAFSGMDDRVRDKCLLFLSHGENLALHYTDRGPRPVESEVKRRSEVVVPGLQEHQVLLCVSHSKMEVPGCVREWMCLQEQGMGAPRWGRWDGPVDLDRERWEEVWRR